MVEPVSTTVVAFLGAKAAEIIGSAVKDHVKGHVKNLLTTGEKKVLGTGDREALTDTYENVLTHAYTQTLNALGRVLELTGIDFPEFVEYQISVERFVKSGKVAEHLLRTVRNLGNDNLPDPALLESEWERLDGKPFPTPGVWNMVAANFRKSTKDKAFVTPQLREVLNAQNLDQIPQLLQKLLGVQIVVRQDQYFKRMLQKFSPVDLANLMPAYAEDPGQMVIRDVFVPQNVRNNPPPVEIPKDLLKHGADELDDQQVEKLRTAYVSQSPKPALDVIAATGNRLVVLTGEPGSGKSTLMRYLLTGIIQPPVDPQSGEALPWTQSLKDAFPLLVELRDFYALRQQDECDSFLEYVHYMGKADHWFLDQQAVNTHLDTGPSLVMFDGLDEIVEHGDRERVMSEIAGFAQRYPKARIIVTSRPVGYKERILRDAGFDHFGIQDLDDGQIDAFIRGWFALTFPQQPQQAEQRVERVLTSVNQSKPIRLLAGNPMLLTMMALLAREEELPRERAKFYEKAVEVLCHHWDANRNLHLPEDRYLNADDKKDLLRRIAMRMVTGASSFNPEPAGDGAADGDSTQNSLSTAGSVLNEGPGLKGNIITEADLEEEIQSFLIDEQWQPNASEARKAARRMIRQLRERNYILCLRGPHLYGFVHRTFLEYLTASQFVQWFDKQPQQMTLDELIALFDAHCRDDDWREVLRLICGQIDEQFVGRIVEHLATRSDLEKWDGKTRLPELPLAIECLSEVRIPSRLDNVGRTMLAAMISMTTKSMYPDISGFIHEDLPHAFNVLGDRWPGSADLDGIAVPHADKIEDMWAQRLWARLVAAVARNHGIITQLAHHSGHGTRVGALHALAGDWQDDATQTLLAERAAGDEHFHPRSLALEALAAFWPAETTRELLAQRAVQDDHASPRRAALQALAEKWPDETTRELLTERARPDGVAASVFGGQHSEFGRIVLTRDLDGVGPYLDPRQPISREHIERAAEKAGIPPEKIDETVRSLSEHLGWDVTHGLG